MNGLKTASKALLVLLATTLLGLVAAGLLGLILSLVALLAGLLWVFLCVVCGGVIVVQVFLCTVTSVKATIGFIQEVANILLDTKPPTANQ